MRMRLSCGNDDPSTPTLGGAQNPHRDGAINMLCVALFYGNVTRLLATSIENVETKGR